MKVALAQIEAIAGDIEGNVAKIADCAGRAAACGCGAVLFPELSDTGYDLDVVRRSASVWPQGAVAERLGDVARRERIFVLAGVAERCGENLYNACMVLNPEGALVARYRKSHLFTLTDEAQCFTHGEGVCAVPIGDSIWGLSICYDLRFPELYRMLALKHGAQVLAECSAWPRVRLAHWDVLTRARAVENQAWMLAVNQVGGSGAGTHAFGGHSRVIDPWGQVVAEASAEEELLVAEIDPALVAQCRQKIPALRDARPELWHW